MNGDGYADVIVGAVHYDNGQTDEGRAYVYHGSASGLCDHAPAGQPRATRLMPTSASSVGTAGDVNGDGYADVIVGAYDYDNGQTDEGRAYVYHGSAAGLSARPPTGRPRATRPRLRFGFSVGDAGDVNGDGYADVIVGACLLRQRPNRGGRGLCLPRLGAAWAVDPG